MARPVPEIIADIQEFKPLNGDWLGLDGLLQELFLSGRAAVGIDAMLRVFERYPSEDGGGVFWSIVHGLESLPGYETRLVESIRMAPSEFALLMLNRLLNSECGEVGDVQLLSLVEQVVKNESACPDVRQAALKILRRREA